MAFPDSAILAAWDACGGRCPCNTESHGHKDGKCGQALLWMMRGGTGYGGWNVFRRTSWGPDALVNCDIRCAKCQGVRMKPPAE